MDGEDGNTGVVGIIPTLHRHFVIMRALQFRRIDSVSAGLEKLNIRIVPRDTEASLHQPVLRVDHRVRPFEDTGEIDGSSHRVVAAENSNNTPSRNRDTLRETSQSQQR